MADVGSLRHLISVVLSKVIAGCDPGGKGEDEEYKVVRVEIQKVFLKYITSTKPEDNIKALSALSSVMLANIDVGISVLLEHLQSTLFM